MIAVGGYAVAWNDPRVLAAAAAVAALLVVLWALGRAARATAPLLDEMTRVGQRVQALSDGQERLAGGLIQVSEQQASAQAAMLRAMEGRLAEVQRAMGESLQGSAVRTARAMGDLHQRLETIDRAQANIEKLSGNVLGLQDILSNKQARGAFGEIQLHDIVTQALPRDAYVMQATLSNGRRADCLIHLPQPPGPIAIDAKFPLEGYEALRRARTDPEKAQAARDFRAAVRAHLKAIAERYILEGETADGALMFLPSEAVYSELHAHFPEVVREGFALRVWIVSPTTCMATLMTMRAVLKDARLREQAGAIRAALRALHRDVELVAERAARLEAHLAQARADVEGIGVAAERAGKRAARIDAFDFEDEAPALPGRVAE